MRTINRPRSRSTTPNQTRERWPATEPRTGRRARVQLISEGVLAGYVHDISQRHRRNFTTVRHRPRHIPEPFDVIEVGA